MNSFIKIACLATVLLAGITAGAQGGSDRFREYSSRYSQTRQSYGDTQVARFGVKAGVNYAGAWGGDGSPHNQIRPNIGITLDFRLSSRIYLLTGLDYSVKGGKGDPYEVDKNGGLNMCTQSDKPAYLQMPLHVGYMFNTPDLKIMPHAGFYVAYGIGGKAEYAYDPLDDRPSWTEKIDFFGVGIGKGDYGVGLGVNVEYNKFVLDLGYDLGLREFAKEYSDGKTQMGYLTIGYKF